MSTKSLIEKFDNDDMLYKLTSFPQQCETAYSIPTNTERILPPKNIIFSAMGGSAIGGDVLKTLCDTYSKTPLYVNREYKFPLWANKDSLFLIASYSGNTEETVNVLKEGLKSNAQIACITSGGEIESISNANKIPIAKLPNGFPPRSAFGYLFFPSYNILANLKILEPFNKNILKKITVWVKEFSPESENNLAIAIAEKIYNKIPVIYSSNMFSSCSSRWKTQLAENSKAFAFTNTFPEMNHNEIMAWRNPKWFIKKCVPIFFESNKEHPRIKLRFQITKEIISKVQPDIITINTEEKSLIENMLYLIILGDWVSFYLAILNKENPTEIEEIQILKKQLTETQ